MLVPGLSTEEPRTQLLVVMGMFILGGIATGIDLAKVFAAIKISPQSSDIIPSLQVYTQRFLAGQYPYDVYNGFGYTLYPTYLPMMWLPYLISEILKIDYRWTAYIVFLSGVLAYELLVAANSSSLFEAAMKALLPFIAVQLFRSAEPEVFGMTVEMMVVGYYLLLAVSIFSRSNLLRALALLFCILSRYSLILWVPVYLALIFFAENRKNAISISLMVFSGILLIYVIPFLSRDWSAYLRGYNCYTSAAVVEWERIIPGVMNDKPYHLFRGVGFAAYFYEYGKGELIDKVLLLKRFHLILSFSSAVVAGLLFFRVKKFVDYRVYSLLALKFCLVFFYTFIQVPYLYLNLVPAFLSFPILAMFECGRESCIPSLEPAERV